MPNFALPRPGLLPAERDYFSNASKDVTVVADPMKAAKVVKCILRVKDTIDAIVKTVESSEGWDDVAKALKGFADNTSGFCKAIGALKFFHDVYKWCETDELGERACEKWDGWKIVNQATLTVSHGLDLVRFIDHFSGIITAAINLSAPLAKVIDVFPPFNTVIKPFIMIPVSITGIALGAIQVCKAQEGIEELRGRVTVWGERANKLDRLEEDGVLQTLSKHYEYRALLSQFETYAALNDYNKELGKQLSLLVEAGVITQEDANALGHQKLDPDVVRASKAMVKAFHCFSKETREHYPELAFYTVFHFQDVQVPLDSPDAKQHEKEKRAALKELASLRADLGFVLGRRPDVNVPVALKDIQALYSFSKEQRDGYGGQIAEVVNGVNRNIGVAPFNQEEQDAMDAALDQARALLTPVPAPAAIAVDPAPIQLGSSLDDRIKFARAAEKLIKDKIVDNVSANYINHCKDQGVKLNIRENRLNHYKKAFDHQARKADRRAFLFDTFAQREGAVPAHIVQNVKKCWDSKVGFYESCNWEAFYEKELRVAAFKIAFSSVMLISGVFSIAVNVCAAACPALLAASAAGMAVATILDALSTLYPLIDNMKKEKKWSSHATDVLAKQALAPQGGPRIGWVPLPGLGHVGGGAAVRDEAA